MSFIYGLFLFLHSGCTFLDEQKYSEVRSQTVLILQDEYLRQRPVLTKTATSEYDFEDNIKPNI